MMSVQDVKTRYFLESFGEVSLALLDFPQSVLPAVACGPLRESRFGLDELLDHSVNEIILAMTDDDGTDMFLEVSLLVKAWTGEGFLMLFDMVLMVILNK